MFTCNVLFVWWIVRTKIRWHRDENVFSLELDGEVGWSCSKSDQVSFEKLSEF